MRHEERTVKMDQKKKKGFLKGFTLIELLVAIAIVSVLVSIALNAFVDARRKAVRTTCLSNLKEIGLAWHIYIIDFDQFPVGDDIAPAADPTYAYGGWDGSAISIDPQERPLNEYLSKGQISQGIARIYHCPGDKVPQAFANTVFVTTGNSYPANLFSSDWDALGGLNPEAVTANHSELILAGDAGWLFDAQGDVSNAHFHSIGGRNFYNILFLDYHVATITMEKGSLSGDGWTVDAIE